jgi:hypothetical protein
VSSFILLILNDKEITEYFDFKFNFNWSILEKHNNNKYVCMLFQLELDFKIIFFVILWHRDVHIV